MYKRKTFEVETLKNQVNHYLATKNPQITDDARLAVIALLETVLHETGNYNGFNYVKWINGGSSLWDVDGQPEDRSPYLGNKTQRFYY